MKSMFVLMAFFAMATATVPLEASEEMDEEVGRFFLVSNSGGTYLGLNSTLLWTAVLGAALIIVVALVLSSGAIPLAAQNYKRYGQQFAQDHFYEDPTQYQTRYKRFAPNDIASKMAQLEQAFKKYQVEEAECEMYIACEASQVQRIDENGPLARIVYDILSTFNRAKDGHKWDDRMDGLVQAFEYGTGAQTADPCQPLRNKCFELHAKY